MSQFKTLDKPALKPLPATRYEYLEFKLARVNIDYHIEFDKPGVWEYFASICSEPGVRHAVENYHLAKSKAVGLAFKSDREVDDINAERYLADRELNKLFSVS